MRVLLAVDGSKNAMAAVDCLIAHAGWYREKPEVELVTVNQPLPKLSRLRPEIDDDYREEGEARLAGAKKRLERAGIPCRPRILAGEVAESIVRHAKDRRCDLICMGTRGMSALGKALVGSTASKVLRLSEIPVLLVK